MPIEFTCPHCGAKTTVADQYVGQTGPCGSCGQTITIPGSPTSHYAPPPTRGGGGGCGLGIILAVVLVAVLVIGILLALLLPAVQAAREAARRMQCSNNMKQIALALLNYEAAHGCYPPAYTVDENGKPLQSWRVLVLPYLERGDLYQQIRLDEPWDSPHNSVFHDMMPPVFRCPSRPVEPNQNDTDYLMITGPGTVGGNPEGTKIREITDGTSQTLLVAESADSGVNWMQPVDLDISKMPRIIGSPGEMASTPCISSYHPGGANAAFCDGSVRFLSADIAPDFLEAFLTEGGGEGVGPDY